jgi:hypothetical protein
MNVRKTIRQRRALERFTTMSRDEWLARHFPAYVPDSLGAILAHAKYESDYQRYLNRKASEQSVLVRTLKAAS